MHKSCPRRISILLGLTGLYSTSILIGQDIAFMQVTMYSKNYNPLHIYDTEYEMSTTRRSRTRKMELERKYCSTSCNRDSTYLPIG